MTGSLPHPHRYIAAAWLTALLLPLVAAAQTLPRHLDLDGSSADVHRTAQELRMSGSAVTAERWMTKLDAGARLLVGAALASGKTAKTGVPAVEMGNLSIEADPVHGLLVDVLVELDHATSVAHLEAAGARLHTQVGNIVAARVPVGALQRLAEARAVQSVEAAMIRHSTNDAALSDTRVRHVHDGTDLPQAYRGEGVIVGVVDSGIDFTHPDFGDGDGTRIRFLWDMADETGTKAPTDLNPNWDWGREYTKAEIDADPSQVRERDGNGGSGHGTHVTGTAAGNGAANAAYLGSAPESDIIFVKGIRDPDSNGGFRDGDVIAGCQYIFEKAAGMGKAAVCNLSLGGHSGPLDGTSLYDRALSGLTGSGRIIVTSGGNKGADFIHAGGTLRTDVPNETILRPTSSERTDAEIWYEAGSVTQVAVGAYRLGEGQILEFLGLSEAVPVGNVVGVEDGKFSPEALEFAGETVGYLYVDATTTRHPDNGDGQVYIIITNNGEAEIDLQNTIWSVLIVASSPGRMDMWANEGEFYPSTIGIENVHEMPGDNQFSVGSPATARKVISVGSYTTKNGWIDVDGSGREYLVPNPDGPGRVAPELKVVSFFSSRGPTRDGRISPHISAPGERIASALSSHVSERATFEELIAGGGVLRSDIVEGGAYHVTQGTSMSSPHVAGVVALMLQADATLDFDRTVGILQETARSDPQTGDVPNNDFGAGRVDALAALQRTVELAGGGTGSAVAAAGIQQVDMDVASGASASMIFELQNLGTSTLSYSITSRLDDVGDATSGAAASPAPVETVPMARPDGRRSALGRPGTAGDRPIIHASDMYASTAGDDVLLLDDGDDTPDDFFGWDNAQALFWSNGFEVPEGGFELNEIRFFMRTENAANAQVTVAISNNEETLRELSLTFPASANGTWYSTMLLDPLGFNAGDAFFITLGAEAGIFFPAGYDESSAVPNLSFFYDWNAEQWTNLNTLQGFQNAAFLIRAAGTLRGGGGGTNQNPVPVLALSSTEADVNEQVIFDGSDSHDPDGEIVAYLWQFGDGATSTQAVAAHSYSEPNGYTVRLTVTDDDGATGEASAHITVSAPAAASPLTVTPASGSIPANGTQAITVTFDAEGLVDGTYEGEINIQSNGGNVILPVRAAVGTAVRIEEADLPAAFRLEQNYPNPFNPVTTITYALPRAAHVVLSIVDVTGRRVVVQDLGMRARGVHETLWDGRSASGDAVASGIYLYRLEAASENGTTASLTRKMALLK